MKVLNFIVKLRELLYMHCLSLKKKSLVIIFVHT